jgi:2-polyprenyl-3-methyl-5-hydroxy-6-metoxy-1,4-benzoquinol methylase
MAGGALVTCSTCGLAFRTPRPSKHELDDLYRSAPSSQWSGSAAERKDFALTEAALEASVSGGRVLDVGCFDGLFLQSLDERYERFGIEINPVAAAVAETRGVKIIGADFDAVNTYQGGYDAVVSIDSFEHTLRPLDFLRDLARLAAPGGWILVSTGNSEARSWRWMGAAYWYCANPEHQCFANRKWAAWAAEQLDLTLIEAQRFSHATPCCFTAFRQFLANVVYRHFPAVFGFVRRSRKSDVAPETPPSWDQSRDHILFVFRKT